MQKESAKNEGLSEGAYVLPVHRFAEGFACWFNDAIVGHPHSEYESEFALFPEDNKFYSDKAGILQAYTVLSGASEMHGTKYVIEHLTEIGGPIIVDLRKKQDERLLRKNPEFEKFFNLFVTKEPHTSL